MTSHRRRALPQHHGPGKIAGYFHRRTGTSITDRESIWNVAQTIPNNGKNSQATFTGGLSNQLFNPVAQAWRGLPRR